MVANPSIIPTSHVAHPGQYRGVDITLHQVSGKFGSLLKTSTPSSRDGFIVAPDGTRWIANLENMLHPMKNAEHKRIFEMLQKSGFIEQGDIVLELVSIGEHSSTKKRYAKMDVVNQQFNIIPEVPSNVDYGHDLPGQVLVASGEIDQAKVELAKKREAVYNTFYLPPALEIRFLGGKDQTRGLSVEDLNLLGGVQGEFPNYFLTPKKVADKLLVAQTPMNDNSSRGLLSFFRQKKTQVPTVPVKSVVLPGNFFGMAANSFPSQEIGKQNSFPIFLSASELQQVGAVSVTQEQINKFIHQLNTGDMDSVLCFLKGFALCVRISTDVSSGNKYEMLYMQDNKPYLLSFCFNVNPKSGQPRVFNLIKRPTNTQLRYPVFFPSQKN